MHAKGLWDTWWAQVQESGIKPLKEFARKLRVLTPRHSRIGKLSAQHLHIEGGWINNKIKLIKRMGMGIEIQTTSSEDKKRLPGKPR
ncbi:transposase [Vibrio chagasii]|nr:transposase [Vibrio chagasii]